MKPFEEQLKETNMKMRVVKPEDSPFSFKAVMDKAIKKVNAEEIELLFRVVRNLETEFRKHERESHKRLEERIAKQETRPMSPQYYDKDGAPSYFDEDRPGAIKIKERDDLPWITMGPNTKRLWKIVMQSIKEESPEYIQEHGDSDEAILFLVLSRYIDEFYGTMEE
jgi:hypothetical protein